MCGIFYWETPTQSFRRWNNATDASPSKDSALESCSLSHWKLVEDIRRDIVAVLSLKSVGAGNFHFLTGKIPPFRRVCVTSRVTKAIGRSPKTCTNEHVLAKNQNFSGTMPRIRWRPSHTPPCRRCGAARLLAPLGSLILQSPVKFFRQLLSAHAERNSTKTGHMLGSECDLKMHVRNPGYPIPLQIGAQKPPLFSTDFTTEQQL